jgi:hypothetical protein
LGGFFLLVVNSQVFLGELICFAPYWGRENNLESIWFTSPVTDLSDPVSTLHKAEMQIYNSSSGCRNAGLQLLLRMQES